MITIIFATEVAQDKANQLLAGTLLSPAARERKTGHSDEGCT
jgi:hypothetical protein